MKHLFICLTGRVVSTYYDYGEQCCRDANLALDQSPIFKRQLFNYLKDAESYAITDYNTKIYIDNVWLLLFRKY